MKYTLLTELGIEADKLDEKKRQTVCRKKYVAGYMTRWLDAAVRRRDVKNINFIDCMCNAGIYRDGDLCTAMEVLLMFAQAAELHKEKRFNLFINDKDKIKTGICAKIAQKLMCDNKCSNINIFINTLDVNDYLPGLHFFGKYFQNRSASVVLVDPNDFGTVKISRLTNFLSRYYCEVIFNIFLSGDMPAIDKRVRSCTGSAAVSNEDELTAYIAGRLRTRKTQYVFSYRFTDSSDSGRYQIIHAASHIKGLEALKEALWETFNVSFYQRDFETEPKQLSMFAEDDRMQALLSKHTRVAKELLQCNFAGRTADFGQIETFLNENTMLSRADVYRSVLKPLIEKRLVIRQGAPESYKDGKYTFTGGMNAWAEDYTAAVPQVSDKAPGLT